MVSHYAAASYCAYTYLTVSAFSAESRTVIYILKGIVKFIVYRIRKGKCGSRGSIDFGPVMLLYYLNVKAFGNKSLGHFLDSF